MSVYVYTPTDAELAEFLQLQQTIKVATERLDELKELMKERGTFSSKKYACLVNEQTQQRLAGLEEVQKVFGRETLERYLLIKQHTFKVVKVSPIVPRQKTE